MLNALELYYELIDFASNENWGNMYLFASKVNSILDVEWLSNKWIINEISNKIKDKLLTVPIIDTQNGERVAIKNEEGKFNIWFPSNKDKTIRNKI